MSSVQERVNHYTTEERLMEHAERYEGGHPFIKIAKRGLEEVAMARHFGALEARHKSVQVFDRHIKSHPQTEILLTA